MLPEVRMKWASIYKAPIEVIMAEFKGAYGKYPNELELNDILLQGEW